MERLQKIISRAGVTSRRQAEELIARGKVTVDGKKVTTLGTKVDPTISVIKVGGKKIHVPKTFDYVLFHKPRKVMVTRSDPEARRTVYDLLPKDLHHLNPVGRLDYDSEGLLLLTNDGEFAQKLAHPRYHVEKKYEVKVIPIPSESQIRRLSQGLLLDGRKTLPIKVEVDRVNPKSEWLKMTLKEGRNRQIRRMCELVGLTVKTLVRTHFGPFSVNEIKKGKWIRINADKIVLKD